MRTIFLIFIVQLISHNAMAQDVYYVTSPELNLRSGPGDNAPVKLKIPQYAPVDVIDTFSSGWWLVKYQTDTGFAYFRYLSKHNPDPFFDWEKVNLSTGQEPPQCENIIPTYDTSIDNYLSITVMNKEQDAIIKLVNATTLVCVRAIYIKAGDSYIMKNVPEGNYYIKEAYGNDFRKSIKNGQCLMRFVRNSLYKRLDKYFDFNIRRTVDSIFVPSYELQVGVFSDNAVDFDKVEGTPVSEDDFNK